MPVLELALALQGGLNDRVPLLARQGARVLRELQEVHAQQVPALLGALGDRQRGRRCGAVQRQHGMQRSVRPPGGLP